MVLEAQAQAQGEEAHPVASEASDQRFRGGSEAGLVQHSANTRTAEVADCRLSLHPLSAGWSRSQGKQTGRGSGRRRGWGVWGRKGEMGGQGTPQWGTAD